MVVQLPSRSRQTTRRRVGENARVRIVPADLDHPAVLALVAEHLTDMHDTSPPESIHALDLDQLRDPDLSFWTLWDGVELVGCGALQVIEPGHAEIKTMRTVAKARGRGVAAS